MPDLPDPTPESVAVWLKSGLSRHDLHTTGWEEANQRFYGLTRAARPYIQEHFKTPAEQEAAFDGLVLGLITLTHFKDIADVNRMLQPLASSPHITSSSHAECRSEPIADQPRMLPPPEQ